MSWNDHDHRGEYADQRHDHDNDYAPLHHRHYDLEKEDERLRDAIRDTGDALGELRGELQAALERIRVLEGQTPQARRLQLEADQAAADLAESGYDRHGRDCGCPYCVAGEPGDLAAEAAEGQVAEPQDICPETSDGYHCTHWQEGLSHCCACGSEPEPAKPEDDPDEPTNRELEPDPPGWYDVPALEEDR